MEEALLHWRQPIDPSREDLTWSIILAFGTGFLSISTLVLSAFDITRVETRD